MPLLYDMPIGIGEPHYAQIIKADKLTPWEVYPEIGWDPETRRVDPNAPSRATSASSATATPVEICMTAVRSHFTPERIRGASRVTT